MENTIITRKNEGILHIIFNRPDKKNALTSDMYRQMHEALSEAQMAEDIRVVIFSATGDAFTAGNDLKDFATWKEVGKDMEKLPVVKFIRSVVQFKKPLIAAVKGAAVGLGTTLLLHCDVVIAGQSSVFALPFVKLGLVPEFGSSFLLPRIAGQVLASHYLLTGEPFDVETARQMRLVSIVCDDQEVEKLAVQKARELMQLPFETLLTIKKMIKSPQYEVELLNVINEELKLFRKGLTSREHQQAIENFFKKR